MAEAILTKQNGVVTMDKSFDYLCSTLKNGTYTVSIKRKVEPRTLSQNALMWLWFACIERETVRISWMFMITIAVSFFHGKYV